jgi:glycosyltransferase involved in cell wall biosynthesis
MSGRAGRERAGDMPMAPDLVVLMTAYNAENTIGKAIESLKRDSEPFDLLIVDDCSRVPLAQVVDRADSSIEIVRPDRNLGVAGAKNFGLKRLLDKPYEFIAMMDADDVSMPRRLAKQVAFLRANPDVALVGSWARYVEEKTRHVVFRCCPPCDPKGIRDALFLNNCMIHPTWMVRTQALRVAGLYSSEFPAAEDYELLRRMSTQFEFANLPECLLDYSISMSGVSMTRRRRQLFDRLRIQAMYFDPWQMNAWIGMARTLVLFAVPRPVVNAYRDRWLHLQYS